MPKRPYPRYQRRHDAILFAVLENPMQTNKEIAKATGYSPSQVSRNYLRGGFSGQIQSRILGNRLQGPRQISGSPQGRQRRPR